MTATPEVDSPSSASTIRNPATGARRRAGALDGSRRRAPDRRRAARGAEGMGGTRRQGPRQSACPLRRLARRAPRRDRVAADQGDRQVGRRCGARGAAADHDPVVLHQDDGEGAGTGDPAGVAAVPGDQEGHRALPAAPGGRHHRAMELPGGQRPDGRHRCAGGRLFGPAQAVRTHAADRGGAAARLARLGRA